MGTSRLYFSTISVSRWALTIVTVLTAFIAFGASASSAPTCSEQYLRDIGAMIINCKQDPTICGAGQTPSASIGKLYMIGDSITEGSRAELGVAFSTRGFSEIIVDGLTSRKLSEGTDPKDGLSVLANNKDKYTTAAVVVIALGTNGGLTAETIKKAVDTVREAPSPAKIFMVNIGVNNAVRNGVLDPTAWNNKLNENSELLNYTIVDWASVVASHPEYIDKNPSTGLGVHPAGSGKKAFAETIATSVSGVATNTSSSGGCSQSTAPAGGDNKEIAYNFFVDRGLSPIQSAAIVGNMTGESGVNPRRMEMTFFKTGHPCHRKKLGWPAETDDPPVENIFGPATDCTGYAGQPTGNVQPGFGLVQWSGGRRQGIIAFAKSKSVLPSDLVTQLEYVWEELNTSYQTRVLTPLRAATTIEVAVDIWVRKYEIPGDPDGAVKSRIPMALDILTKYGSN